MHEIYYEFTTATVRSEAERDGEKGSSKHADNKQQQHKIPIKTQVEEIKTEFRSKQQEKKAAKIKSDTLLKHVVMKNPPYATCAHFRLPIFAGNESAMT